MSGDDFVYLTVEKMIKETPKAVLFKLDEGGDDDNEQWFPRSVLEDESPDEDDVKGQEVGVKRWFCDKEDLPY